MFKKIKISSGKFNEIVNYHIEDSEIIINKNFSSFDDMLNEVENCKNKRIERKYFILDTDKDSFTVTHGTGDVTYIKYCYNKHINNKLKEGSVFLYRQKAKGSMYNKFYLFGGGIVKHIDEVNTAGDMEAYITLPFELDPIIFSDSISLNSVQWTSKKKVNNTWVHFWNQYGINEITRDEFFQIIKDVDLNF